MKVLMKVTLLVSLCALISCDGHFTVIGSKSVNRNGKYSVAITSRNFSDSDPPILEVAIHSQGSIERIAQNVTLINGKSQSAEFDISGSLVGDHMNLTINCISGMSFSRTVMLTLNNYGDSVFVQTDKTIYKPSDTIRFRVLGLDEDGKPLNPNNTLLEIFVIDGAQNKLEPCPPTISPKGVYEGEFRLSDSPIFGDWYIETLLPNNVVKRHRFKVAEYTLPSFQLTLNVKSHVSYAEGQITAFLRAKHTFGDLANGTAIITAKVKNKTTLPKPIEINGSTSVNFHIERDLELLDESVDHTVEIFVNFTEEITGKSQNATAIVQLHAVPYELKLKAKSNQFKPGLLYTIEAILQYHESNVQLTDNENPVTFNILLVKNDICTKEKVGKRRKVSYIMVCSGGLSEPKEYKVYPSNGTSKIEFRVPDYIDYLNVSASYLQAKISPKKILSAPSEKDHYIAIKSKTETPTLSQNVKINIQSVKRFTEFSYHVFSIQGRLIASDTIQVLPTQDYDFEFTPTDDIKDDVKIIVFYITDYGEIVLDSLIIEFSKLKNFVDIQISHESVEPGDEITIDITTNPNSLVGLLATDHSLSFLDGMNVINGTINDENKSDVFFIIHPGSDSFIPFSGDTDIKGPCFIDNKEEVYGFSEPSELLYRTSFPETWLFETIDFGVNESQQSIFRNAPDTITYWTMTAFSINPTTGLAKTSRPTMLKTFKKFFISMDLPYSIKQNEIVSIPISLFNYMNVDQEAEITLYNEDSGFEIIRPVDDEPCQQYSRTQMTKCLRVNKRSGASTSFQIRANQTGQIKLRAFAKSPLSNGDGVVRDLLVKPEGTVYYMNEALLIDSSGGVKWYNLNVDIPAAADVNSIKIQASIVGNILGLSGNMQNLLKFPVRCSEQNMINFVPNIVVLDYLSAVNELTKEVRAVAIENLRLGYQKQLRYKNVDGSFNVWGRINESGSTWLTAFMVKSFSQAKRYIYVEPDIIAKGFRFLSQTQSPDGSFKEVGYAFRKDITNPSSNKFALTAYVLIAFLEHSDYIEKYSSTILNATNFLSQNVNDITETFPLAIASYALQLARNDLIKDLALTKLQGAAIRDGETMRWKGSASEFPDNTNTFDKASSLDVETTAYALHAFMAAGHLNDSVRIAKWLVTQRNENGGFVSTLDTVVALQALSKVAAKINASNNNNLRVTVNSIDAPPHEFNVHPFNALVLQTKDMPTTARHFEITAKGHGFGIFQISYQYNVDEIADESHKFNISRPNVHGTVDSRAFFLEFCVCYNPDENNATSNMVALEVNFPTGCTFLKDFEKELNSTDNIKDIDYSDPTSVKVWFDHMTERNICPQFHYLKSRYVDNNEQHGSINVFDYYNIKRRTGARF